MAAVEVRVLTTPEQVPDDAGQDIGLLDVAPSAPAPPPSGDAVQDVVVELPQAHGFAADAMRLSFDTAAADLTHRVAEVCDTVYVLASNPGVFELGRAFHGTGRASGLGGMLVPVSGRGDTMYLDEQRTPRRHKLVMAHDAYLRELPGRRAAMLAMVQSNASASALSRLEASRAQVAREAQRYLSLASGEANARAFLEGGSRVTRLTGPEVTDLAGDLLRIAAARDELERRDAALAATKRSAEVARWNEGKRSIVEQDLERLRAHQGYLTERQIMDVARAYELGGPAPVEREAQRTVDEQRMAVASLIAQLGAGRPVLYRIWDGDLPFEVRAALREGRPTNVVQQRAILADLVPLREAVLDALTTTWEASGDMLERFRDDPAVCWRFRALVEATLADLHADESNVSWRAAQDHLGEEEPGGELGVVARWLGHVALAAGLSGAEPVAAIATVAQLAVDLIRIVVKALAVHEQRTSLDAFLSPSAGFVVDPTYSSLAVDVLWFAIGVWFGRGELRKVLVL